MKMQSYFALHSPRVVEARLGGSVEDTIELTTHARETQEISQVKTWQ